MLRIAFIIIYRQCFLQIEPITSHLASCSTINFLGNLFNNHSQLPNNITYFRTHWIHFASKHCLILIFTICQDLKLSSGECDPLCSVDETSSQEFEANYQPRTDLLKAVAIFAAAATGTVAINHSWVAANQVSFTYTKVGL